MEAKDTFILQLFPRFSTEAESESFGHLLQTARLVVRPDTCVKRHHTRGITSAAIELWLEGQAKGRESVALFLWPSQSRASDIVSWLESLNNKAPEIRRARKVLMVVDGLWPFIADGFGADPKEPMFQVDCRWIDWETRQSQPQLLLVVRQSEKYGFSQADALALHLGTRMPEEIKREYRRLKTGTFPRAPREDQTEQVPLESPTVDTQPQSAADEKAITISPPPPVPAPLKPSG